MILKLSKKLLSAGIASSFEDTYSWLSAGSGSGNGGGPGDAGMDSWLWNLTTGGENNLFSTLSQSLGELNEGVAGLITQMSGDGDSYKQSVNDVKESNFRFA